MNLWLRKPITQNPYERNAFQVARVGRAITQRSHIARLVSVTRRIITNDPQAHLIHAEAVSIAELNLAEQILFDPQQRILEELFEHAAEKPPVEHLRRLAQEIDAGLSADGASANAASAGGASAGQTAPRLRPAALAAWRQALAREVVAALDAPDPSLGALELDSDPPFGRAQKE